MAGIVHRMMAGGGAMPAALAVMAAGFPAMVIARLAMVVGCLVMVIIKLLTACRLAKHPGRKEKYLVICSSVRFFS